MTSGLKPDFQHPQSQSLKPDIVSANDDNTLDIRSYIDEQIQNHIHDGTRARRINANTDIIGLNVTTYYKGYVNSGGTAGNPFPANWTVSVGSGGTVGRYTVTHNLGTTDYVTMFSPVSIGVAQPSIWNLFAKGSSSFVVEFYQASGSTFVATDTDFEFVLLS